MRIQLLRLLIAVLSGALFFMCEDPDQFGLVEDGGNLPPQIDFSSIPSSFPAGQPFTVTVNFTDGLSEDISLSPLSSGTVVMTDPIGNEVFRVTQSLSGTSSSITQEVDDTTLPDTTYTISAIVTDVDGNQTEGSVSVAITVDPCPGIDRPFASEQCQMFILGEFNGWGNSTDEFTLVADNIWEQQISFEGPWKLVAAPNFNESLDWGDNECDGIADEFGANIECGSTTNVTIRFNDLTLEYEIIPGFDNIFGELFLLGTINNFEGTDNAFSLVANNTYRLENIRLSSSDEFRISLTSTLSDMHFGDNEGAQFSESEDGVAVGELDEFGSNISLPPGSPQDGIYNIEVNDSTLEYRIELVEALAFGSNFNEMFIIGNFSGWGNEDLSVEMDLVDNNVWSGTIDPANFDAGFSEPYIFKFVSAPTFGPTDWGVAPDGDVSALTGVAFDGEGEQNIEPGISSGLVDVTFNDETLEYTITPQ